MRKTTRRILFWAGIALVLLPPAVAVFALFQPREYQSSVFIEVRQPGQPPPPPPPLIDRETLYAILVVVAAYLPGNFLLLIVFLSRRRERKVHGTPTT